MIKNNTITVKDWAVNLGPRYKHMNGMNTTHSGEAFREDVLIPMLIAVPDEEKVYIDTQGTNAAFTCWHEVFIGLATPEHIHNITSDRIVIDGNKLTRDLTIAQQAYLEAKKDIENIQEKK